MGAGICILRAHLELHCQSMAVSTPSAVCCSGRASVPISVVTLSLDRRRQGRTVICCTQLRERLGCRGCVPAAIECACCRHDIDIALPQSRSHSAGRSAAGVPLLSCSFRCFEAGWPAKLRRFVGEKREAELRSFGEMCNRILRCRRSFQCHVVFHLQCDEINTAFARLHCHHPSRLAARDQRPRTRRAGDRILNAPHQTPQAPSRSSETSRSPPGLESWTIIIISSLVLR